MPPDNATNDAQELQAAGGQDLQLHAQEGGAGEPANNGVPKPTWQRFLESSGGTALITVLLGGAFGQLISGSIQENAKKREFQQSWMQAQGNQALLYYKEYLTEEQAVVKSTYEVAGKCISASEDLIILTGSEFDPDRYTGKPQLVIMRQREGTRERFNTCDAQWRDEREKLGLLMSFYHRSKPEIVRDWTSVQDDLTDFMWCARKWYLSHETAVDDATTRTACKDGKDKVRSDLHTLSKDLDAVRSYAWEGWESPENLKALLEK